MQSESVMKRSHGYDGWFAEERTWTARVTCPDPAELYPGEKGPFSIFDGLQKNLVFCRKMWYFSRKIRICYRGNGDLLELPWKGDAGEESTQGANAVQPSLATLGEGQVQSSPAEDGLSQAASPAPPQKLHGGGLAIRKTRSADYM